jgi:hypothetical protein
MRNFCFAVLAVSALWLSGCGEKKAPAPPAGADQAETPDIQIDPGVEMPGEEKE